MHVRIIAVGRQKAGPERDLAGRYLDRFAKAGRPLGISRTELVELPESRAATAPLRMDQEADAIRRSLEKVDWWCLLDERGADRSSESFARSLGARKDRSTGTIAFVIGGADGASDALRGEAPAMMGFGRMTWPHQMARIMLCEQLYRAATILSGHPYHRT